MHPLQVAYGHFGPINYYTSLNNQNAYASLYKKEVPSLVFRQPVGDLDATCGTMIHFGPKSGLR